MRLIKKSPDSQASEAAAKAHEASSAESAFRAFPWLLRQKIAIPDPVKGYCHRPELVARAMPTQRRLTVLQAPGGFGKTTLLAECCRSLRGDGVAVAWLSIEGQDQALVLGTYLAMACASAGVNLSASAGGEAAEGEDGRFGVVTHAIESFGKPVVMAFDEVEQLDSPAFAAFIGFLIQSGPPNLHVAVTGREIPDGLNVASTQLEGRAEVLGAEDLRFSASETARLFGLRLSRRALAEEIDRSAGWPFALRISLFSFEQRAETSGDVGSGTAGNWIESRLFADLDRDDRDFVLDLGLFDWIDAGLLDEVLQRADWTSRLESIRSLAGLIEQVGDGEAEVWRLHPLLREHCAKRRVREDAERAHAIHRRLAEALAMRQEIVLAMRHAVAGGDPFLAGRILEQAGGVRLWIRQGVAQFQAALQLLSQEVISKSPRLMLAQSAAMALSGRSHEARAIRRECAERIEGASDIDVEYLADECLVRGGLVLYTGEPLGGDSVRALIHDMAQLEGSQHLDSLTRGYLEYAFSVQHFLQGEFDAVVERLSVASDYFGESNYLIVFGEHMRGQIEFLKGRTESAEAHFLRSQRIAKKHHALDPVARISGKTVIKELALERNPAPGAEPRGLRQTLLGVGVPFSFFATGVNVLIDTLLQSGCVDRALAVADEVLGHVRRGGMTAFVRLVAALRVSLLVRAGRAEEAGRAYQREALPTDPAGCVDMTAQSWRESVAVSEARARLLIAQARFDEARSLLGAWRSVAAQRGWPRMELRVLALLITAESQAGETEASLRPVGDYLKRFAESPFAWPLVRDRAACAGPLREYLALHPESPHRPAAHSLLEAMRRMENDLDLTLNEREREVLSLLPGRQVKQVAAAVGLTVHGVRFHLRKLFTKLDVSNRTDLLRRAADLGLIERDA